MTEQPPTILVLDRSGAVAGPVRDAARLVDGSPEVVLAGGPEIPDELVGPDRALVVVAGPSWTGSAGTLRKLAAAQRRAPAASLLLAVNGRPEASLREMVQTGADDLLPLPLSAEDIAGAVRRGLRIASRRAAALNATGRIVTVASPTGGAGKTFLATNLAVFLARTTGQRVVLVDLDLQFGEVCTALRLRPETSIVDAAEVVRAGGPEADQLLAELLLTHESGFSVLAAPANPVEADSITAADVDQILQRLRRIADHVVVDTPAGISPHSLAAFGRSDSVVALSTPGRPSLHNLDRFLGAIGTAQAALDTSLVVNMQPEGADPDLSDFAGRFPQGFMAVLPHDREATRSINFGVPLMAGTTSSPLSRALAATLPKLLPGADRTAVLWAPRAAQPEPVTPPPATPVEPADIDLTESEPELVPEPASTSASPTSDAPSCPARPRRLRTRHTVAGARRCPVRPDRPSGRVRAAGHRRELARLRAPPGGRMECDRCVRYAPGSVIVSRRRSSSCHSSSTWARRCASSPLLSRTTSATARRSASVA